MFQCLVHIGIVDNTERHHPILQKHTYLLQFDTYLDTMLVDNQHCFQMDQPYPQLYTPHPNLTRCTNHILPLKCNHFHHLDKLVRLQVFGNWSL